MKRGAISFCMGLLLLGLAPGPVAAVGVLDQASTVVDSTVNSTVPSAQTFRAGKTGKLSQVQLNLSGTGTMNVSVRATSGGLPTGGNLATSTNSILPGATHNWVTFRFSAPIQVTSGQTYAIVFTMGAGRVALGSTTNAYSRGQALTDPGGSWLPINVSFLDFAFRTYVTLPVVATRTPTPTHRPSASLSPSPSPTTSTPTATPTPTEPPSLEPVALVTETPSTEPTATQAAVVNPFGNSGSSDTPILPIVGGVAGLGVLVGAVLLLNRRKGAPTA